MWVSPVQTAVQELIDRFGIRVYEMNLQGRLVGRVGDRRFQVPEEAWDKGLPMLSRLRLGLAASRIRRLMDDIDPERPWASPRAEEYDRETVASWMNRNIRDRTVREVVDFTVKSVFCAESNELSLLFWLFYLKALGGLEVATQGGPGGAQNQLCVGGLHQLATGLAEPLGEALHLSEPAVSVTQTDSGVTVRTAGATYRAKRVICAVPPTLLEHIDFLPKLPTPRQQLLQRQVMGSCIKIWVAWERPFWRNQGYNGMIADAQADFSPVFDAGPPDSDIGLLAGFIEGRAADTWSDQSEEARRDMVLKTLESALGPEARHPIDYVERDWTGERWSRGCYGAFLPPGALTRFGHAIRQPFGRIHWAGTETASVWSGYVEGAIRSGRRAAEEAASQMS